MRCSSGQSRNEDCVVLMNDVVDAVCPFVGGDDLVYRDAMGGGDTEQRDIRIIDAATGVRKLTLNPNIDYQPTGAPKGQTHPKK